jgi:glyoxylate/hydroxypyruvate reductase A
MRRPGPARAPLNPETVPMTRDLLLFHSPRSDPSWPARLAEALPEVEVTTDIDTPEPGRVTGAVVWIPPPGALARFPRLRFVQAMGAGVDHLLADPTLPPGLPIARLSEPGLVRLVAEYVLTHALALLRGLPALARAQAAGTWGYVVPRPAAEATVAVLGAGAIGGEAARLLQAAGFRVLGWGRRPRSDDSPFPVLSGAQGLARALGEADIVVLLLPLTPATRDLVDAGFLAGMKPGAALINAGRGALVDEDALLAALDEGRLSHAVLDVFRTEPLPGGHPFWTHPRVTVTPHNAGATRPDSALAAVVANVRRGLRGEPMADLVDRSAGY